MKKFILIDQSIRNSGGHHLEYALRVLKAAKNQGFKTILVVNKKSTSFHFDEIDRLEKSFTHDFWESQSALLDLSSWKSAYKSLIQKKDKIFYRLISSSLGAAFLLLHRDKSFWKLFKKHQDLEGKKFISLGVIFVAFFCFYLNEKSKAFLKSFRFLKKLNWFFKGVWEVFKFLGVLIGMILSVPFILLHSLLMGRTNLFRRKERKAELFGKECVDVLSKIKAGQGDLVFIPTLGFNELLGLSKKIKNCPRGLSWHLLFRRNLFVGREPNYLKEMDAKTEPVLLAACKEHLLKERVFFYTDTKPLAEQYNLLACFNFQPLPIPHDELLGSALRHSKPFVVSYIGDARNEKGFSYLPKLILDMKAEGWGVEKLKFIIQSNFNTVLGDVECRIAKAELSLLKNQGVELLEGPFDSHQYTSLVNASNVILVPYDEVNYYARSSGVFSEALAAGVPVIFPLRSWMGQELAEENFAYARKQRGKSKKSSSFRFRNGVKFRVECVSSHPVVFISFRYELKFRHPGLYFRLSIRKKRETHPVATALIDLRFLKGDFFLQIMESGDYVIDIAPDSSLDETIISSEVENYFSSLFFQMDLCTELKPLQAVGFGYQNLAELKSGLVEILSHYDHYKNSCVEFSKKWKKYHSSTNLVSLLSAEEISE